MVNSGRCEVDFSQSIRDYSANTNDTTHFLFGIDLKFRWILNHCGWLIEMHALRGLEYIWIELWMHVWRHEDFAQACRTI